MNLFQWLRDLWQQHKEDKKKQELHARLERNSVRWTKAQYIQDSKKVQKAQKARK